MDEWHSLEVSIAIEITGEATHGESGMGLHNIYHSYHDQSIISKRHDERFRQWY